MGEIASTIWKKLQQPAERSYESYFKQSLWSLKEFACLITGITPLEFTRFQGPKGTVEDLKKVRQVLIIQKKVGKYVTKNLYQLSLHPIDNEIYMPRWQFIKWIALNAIPIKRKFLSSLSLELMELYIEFQPVNTHLRTANKHSRAYHKSLYLTHARDLVATCGPLTPIQIYKHPRMQGVMKSFQGLKRSYPKSTLLQFWLPDLVKRPRGRPKKAIE